jgi:anaerobic selenocysteine-containing dehydrogenase
VDVPHEPGWVRETMLPEGRWRIAPAAMLERLAHRDAPGPEMVLVPRREMAWSNSVRYGGTGDEAVVRLHPDDATAAAIGAGSRVEVRSVHGHLTATVAIDANVRRGAVSVTHGRGAASPGQLTSSHAGVDRLTAMPHASGVAVTISSPSPSTDPGRS